MKFFAALVAVTLPAFCTPPAPAPPVRSCPDFEHLLVLHQPEGGWDVGRMSAYMYRESRCTPVIRSRTRDSGLLQVNDINHAYLRQHLGEWVDAWTLMDPHQNVRAAAELCEFWRNAGRSCYRAWGGSG